MQFTISSILVNVIAPDPDKIVTTCTGEMFEGQGRLYKIVSIRVHHASCNRLRLITCISWLPVVYFRLNILHVQLFIGWKSSVSKCDGPRFSQDCHNLRWRNISSVSQMLCTVISKIAHYANYNRLNPFGWIFSVELIARVNIGFYRLSMIHLQLSLSGWILHSSEIQLDMYCTFYVKIQDTICMKM